MSTTQECKVALHEMVQEWFLSPDPMYAVPIAQENIIGYLTAPKETSASPNWIIMYTINTTAESFVLGGGNRPALFGFLLASRLSKGSDAEASRQLAEQWLDDAEEMLMDLLPMAKNALWSEIHLYQPPQRDAEPLLRKLFRSSQLAIKMEKK